MPDSAGPNQIARLEGRVAADPGAPEFAALCDALRREGRLAEAEEVARRGLAHKPGSLEGLLALALVLLDRDRPAEARELLAARSAEAFATRSAAEPAPTAAPELAGDLTDGELEVAFASAEPEHEQLLDADRVAQEAMRDACLDEPEAVPLAAEPFFATRTMAELLERQGDADGAERIRRALAGAAPEEAPAAAEPAPAVSRDERNRIVSTLETWLANLRRASR